MMNKRRLSAALLLLAALMLITVFLYAPMKVSAAAGDYSLTIVTSGVSSSYPARVYLGGSQVGTAYDGSPCTLWFISGTSTGTIGVDATVSGAAGTRFVFTKWDADSSTSNPRAAVTMSASVTYKADFKTQYQLTVSSAYDTPGGANWYDSGSTAYATLSSGTVSGGTGTQYVFTGWSGDASGTGLTSSAITMNAAKTATAVWQTQYMLTVNSAYGFASGAGWFDASSTPSIDMTDTTVSGSGTRYVFFGWSSSDSGGYSGPDASHSVTMSSPITETASWNTEYELIVNSVHGGPTGADWYTANAVVNFGVTSPDGTSGTRYVTTGYTGDASGSGSSGSVTMSSAKTVTFGWTTQYEVTFGQTGLDSTATGTVVNVGGSAKIFTDLPLTGWFDSGTTYSFTEPVTCSNPSYHFGWTGVSSTDGSIEGPGTITGTYVRVPQFAIPVMPLGTLMAVFSMVATLGGYVGLRRHRLTAKGHRSSARAISCEESTQHLA